MSDYRSCVDACSKLNTSCPNKSCRKWIDYEEDLNCTLISVEKNDKMSLEAISKRVGYSATRIKQIEEAALCKLKYKYKLKLDLDPKE